jgi:cytochrome P450
MAGENFFDPEVVECPYPFYQSVRSHSPVLEIAAPGSDQTMFLVTRFDLVAEILKDSGRFSSQFMNPVGRDRSDPDVSEVYAQGWPWVDTLLTSDPPEHRRYRSLVNRAFTGRRVRELEPFIERVAHELIDAFIDAGRCDFASAYARQLPLRVIADQFGVPSADLADFRKWSDSFVARLGGLISKDQEMACARDIIALQNYLKTRIDACRREAQDNIMSDLVHAHTGDEIALSDAELINMLQQLLVAGNETTANTMAGGLMYLLREPDQVSAVYADPTLLDGLVEESLRTVSAQSGMWRIATQDTQLAGTPIPRGATILLRYDAANRDPEQFEDPETFNLRRPARPGHLSFGLGIHFCVGAALARKELEVGFRLLFARIRNIRLGEDNDFRHQPNMLLRGLRQLHITFDVR